MTDHKCIYCKKWVTQYRKNGFEYTHCANCGAISKLKAATKEESTK